MAQWVKHLPCEREDMSLDPQNPHKAGPICNLNTPTARQELAIGASQILLGQLI